MSTISGKRTPSTWAKLTFALALGTAGHAAEVFADAAFPPTLESATFFGGAGDQRGTGVATQGGSIYLSGIEGQGSDLEALALRFANPPGSSPLWSTRWPNPTGSAAPIDDWFLGVAATAEGVYFPGGSYSQTSDGVGGKESKSIVAKFPLIGGTTPTWVAKPHFFPYTGSEGLYAVAGAVEGGVPVIYSAGGGQPCSYGAYVLTKFDASGNLLGKATDPGQENAFNTCSYNGVGSHGAGVAVLNGAVYAAGSRGGFPTIWKHAPNLSVTWRREDTAAANAQFLAVTAVDGAVYAVGQTNGAAGSEQYLVHRYDESGNRVWSRTFGGANSDVLTGATGLGNRLFVVGYTRSQGSGGSDGVLMEIDPATGNPLSTTYFGGAADDSFRGISTDGTDLYVVGESRSFASAAGNAVGQNDLALLRYALGPPALATITVTPSDRSINVGQTQLFTATGTFSDGSTRTLTTGPGVWASAASIPSASYGLGGAFVGGKFYAISGFATPRLAIYNPGSNTWTSGASLPADSGYNLRQYFGSAVVDGKIYVVGGDTGGSGDRNTLYRYDPAANNWAVLAPMPLGGRYALGAAAINGKIYAVGGYSISSSSYLARLEVYDPASNSWTTKAPMPVPVASALVGAINGRLLVAGGSGPSGPLTALHVYDPLTDSWSSGAPLPFAISGDGAALGGRLFAVSGSHVIAYDAATDSWSSDLAPMPSYRTGLGVAVDEANNRIYGVGGWTGSGYSYALEVFTPSEAAWSSGATSVATINQAGLATGLGAGTTTIAASSGGVAGSTTLTVLSPNQPPVANAGPDQTVEATGPAGAAVTLNGAASSDPDGDALSYTWRGAFGAVNGVNMTRSFALGPHTAILEVFDGQATASDPVGILVEDTTAPVLGLPASSTVEATSAAGATVHYSVAAMDVVDASPTISCTPPSASIFAIATTPVTCTATDASGNSSAPGGFDIAVVDTTPPVLSVPEPIVIYATTPADATVFYSVSATDLVDPDPSLLCTPPSGTNFGLGLTPVNCFAADAAGNQASPASFTVQIIDFEAPVLILPDTITVSATGPDGAPVTYTVSATDGFDENPEVSCTPAAGSTFAPGTTRVECKAKDDSGNEGNGGFDVRVVYTFDGFFQPIENPGALNVVKAGSAVPVKFSLHGDFGLSILAPGYPRSETVACDVTTSVNGVDETATAGGSSLAYDASLDQYKYVWKTEKAWVGTCRQLVVKLSDGTFHWANFMLK